MIFSLVFIQIVSFLFLSLHRYLPIKILHRYRRWTVQWWKSLFDQANQWIKRNQSLKTKTIYHLYWYSFLFFLAHYPHITLPFILPKKKLVNIRFLSLPSFPLCLSLMICKSKILRSILLLFFCSFVYAILMISALR